MAVRTPSRISAAGTASAPPYASDRSFSDPCRAAKSTHTTGASSSSASFWRTPTVSRTGTAA
jgi:hypothetical protein